MAVFAGVDGGGTRTRAVLLDGEGRELGRAEGEGAVASAERPEAAAEAVRHALEGAARAAGVKLPVDVLWAGLAGAGTEAPRAAVTEALRGHGLAHRLVVGTDVEAAFHDAFGEGPGLLLVAGTGSIAWARDAAGAEHRIGGWGSALGDDGSGYRIGLEALRRLLRAEDGREPAGSMKAPLLSRCGVRAPEELVTWVETAPKAAIAALAPIVVAAADAGDPAGVAVVELAVAELVDHVEAARGRLGASEADAPVALWGGLIAPGGPLRGRTIRALAEAGIEVRPGAIDPPRGAARLALGA